MREAERHSDIIYAHVEAKDKRIAELEKEIALWKRLRDEEKAQAIVLRARIEGAEKVHLGFNGQWSTNAGELFSTSYKTVYAVPVEVETFGGEG
jgi:hypothetical protein